MKIKILIMFLAVILLSNSPSFAKNTTVSEIENIDKENSKKEIDRNHWAYKRLVNISQKHGLLIGDSDTFFNDNKPLSRNEAAVILVNLMGKVREDFDALSEVEKEQINILKEEFNKEIAFISGRIDKMENAVDAIRGSISRIEESNRKNVQYGFGEKMKIQSLMQIKYAGIVERGADKEKANFNIPFSRIRLEGKIQKHLDYRVDIRPDVTFNNTTRNGLLNNAYISSDIIPYNKLYLGQMRTPIGYEGCACPEDLDFVNRAQISRNFSNTRDIGLQIKGFTKFIDYKAGIFNGQGYNSADSINTSVDYVVWGEIKPLALLPQYGLLKFGGGYYDGSKGTGSRSSSYLNNNHNTVSYYAEYDYKKFGLKGEYAVKEGYGSTYNKKADGWYMQADYFLTDKIQFLSRFDLFRPDFAIKNNDLKEYTAGLNYYLNNKNIKLQFNYVFVNNYTFKDGHKLYVLAQYLL